MHEHYEDCPWREQALYAMDSRNQMLCGYYAFSETRFPRACLDLISYGQRPDGLLSLCYPAGLDLPIPSFSLVWFIAMREYITHSGDTTLAAQRFHILERLIDTFHRNRDEGGLVKTFTGTEVRIWNFYEWSPTTFWETIKGEADFDDAGSLCHGWSALPVYYYETLTE